jgi:hypothetical protein
MKNKKVIITAIIITIVLLLLIIGVVVKKSTVNLSPRARDAVANMQQKNATRTFILLKSLTPKEKKEVITWMQANPEKVPPFYYMYFADDIFAKNKDEAALWFVIGRLRATEDVQMCKDKTATSQIAIYPMIAPKTLRYIALKKDYSYIVSIVEKAIKWDEAHPKRVNPVWSCFHGMEAFSHYPELLPMSEYERIQKQTRIDVLKLVNERIKNHS